MPLHQYGYSIPILPLSSLTSFLHRMLSLNRWLCFCPIKVIQFESLLPGLYVASAIPHHSDCQKLSWLMDKLQRELATSLTPGSSPDAPLQALGHAYGLAALVSIVPYWPLYVSYDVSAKVLDMATQLLKCAGEHDVKVFGIEVKVAWTLIASLMSLGPNFVRPHLPQLLVLWRNARPKPTSKDSASNAGWPIVEWLFLLRIRESALGAIWCFLQHNSSNPGESWCGQTDCFVIKQCSIIC